MAVELMTKAKQVEQSLRKAINVGDLRVGDAVPPERELLEQFGVSRATLREALNALANDGLIIRKQRRGTFVAEKGNTTTQCIGIIARSTLLTSPVGYFIQQTLDCARKSVFAAGMRPLLFVGDGASPEEFISSLTVMDPSVIRDMAGVLFISDAGELEKDISDSGIPCVSVGHWSSRVRHNVVLSYDALIEVAVKELRAQGHEDFAIMYTDYGSDPLRRLSNDGVYSHQATLFRSAVGFRDERTLVVPWSPSYHHAYEVFKQWWKRPDRPKAIFFTDDALFDTASRAVLELGIKVPEELAIMTQVNVGREFAFPVPVCGVGFDATQKVAAGWKMLRKLMAGEHEDEPVVFLVPVIREGKSL